MARITLSGGRLRVERGPWEHLLSFHRGPVEAPAVAVRDAAAVPDPWSHFRGWRAPGTGYPGLMIGTARGRGFKDFCVLRGSGPAWIVSLDPMLSEFDRWLVTTDEDIAPLRRALGLGPG